MRPRENSNLGKNKEKLQCLSFLAIDGELASGCPSPSFPPDRRLTAKRLSKKCPNVYIGQPIAAKKDVPIDAPPFTRHFDYCSPTPPVITRRKSSRTLLPLAIRSFRHSSKAASLMAEVPTSVLRLPPMAVLTGSMVPCPVPPSTQHRRDRMPVPAMPRWPSMPSTTSG